MELGAVSNVAQFELADRRTDSLYVGGLSGFKFIISFAELFIAMALDFLALCQKPFQILSQTMTKCQQAPFSMPPHHPRL